MKMLRDKRGTKVCGGEQPEEREVLWGWRQGTGNVFLNNTYVWDNSVNLFNIENQVNCVQKEHQKSSEQIVRKES